MALKIRTRKSWSARRPRSRTPQNPRNIREFFLHYPASGHGLAHINTDQEQDAFMRGIQNFHMDDRGWSDFAYNFAVFQDGEVYRGRGMHWVPAGQGGHNTNTLAILCVLGNTETPSDRMKNALRDLKNYCDKKCGRDLTVRPHSSVNSTSCPGDRLRGFVSILNRS